MVLMLIIITVAAVFIILDVAIFEDGAAVVLAGLIIGLFIVTPLIVSYNSYLNLRQYHDSRQLEHDLKAIRAAKTLLENDDNLLAETKDGYYNEVISGIGEARRNLLDYNQTIISKRIMNDNILLSWYIIMPDSDLKIISPEEYEW